MHPKQPASGPFNAPPAAPPPKPPATALPPQLTTATGESPPHPIREEHIRPHIPPSNKPPQPPPPIGLSSGGSSGSKSRDPLPNTFAGEYLMEPLWRSPGKPPPLRGPSAQTATNENFVFINRELPPRPPPRRASPHEVHIRPRLPNVAYPFEMCIASVGLLHVYRVDGSVAKGFPKPPPEGASFEERLFGLGYRAGILFSLACGWN